MVIGLVSKSLVFINVKVLCKDFFRAIKVVFFGHQVEPFRYEQESPNQGIKPFIFKELKFLVDVELLILLNAVCFAKFLHPWSFCLFLLKFYSKNYKIITLSSIMYLSYYFWFFDPLPVLYWLSSNWLWSSLMYCYFLACYLSNT